VQACLLETQVPYGTACGDATATDGGFAVTDSLCNAVFWSVATIQGANGHSISCSTGGSGDVTLTPADCMCLTSTGVDTQHAAATGCVDVAEGGADADATADAGSDAPSGS
jgi:hypothetical protein